jgi:uncharacterized membrane protein YgcG
VRTTNTQVLLCFWVHAGQELPSGQPSHQDQQQTPTPPFAYTALFLCAQVKSYLAGNPPIKIKLNDDLLITRRDGSGYSGGGSYGGGSGFSAGDYASDSSLVILDDVNFHEVGAACEVEKNRGVCEYTSACLVALWNWGIWIVTLHARVPQAQASLAPQQRLNAMAAAQRDGSSYSGGGGYGSGSGFSAGDYASDSSLVILDDVNFHEVGAACDVKTTGLC